MDDPEAVLCIVCMEDMAVGPDVSALDDLRDAGEVAAGETTEQSPQPSEKTNNQNVAIIKPCDHFLHDHCLRVWAKNANSCPFCRQAFNSVHVLDCVGGRFLSEYAVEDKKQVAEFNVNAWLEQNPEEEDGPPCPICGAADQPEVLLLCDGCDANYHTHCVELSSIPSGEWYCMECVELGVEASATNFATTASPSRNEPIRGRHQPRTQASQRRDRGRGRLRNEVWSDTWNQVGHRIHNAIGLDLDFSEDDGMAASFRRLQDRTNRHQWDRRLEIASRQGARDVFRAAVPFARRTPTPQTPVETVEEVKAWGAFEKAKKVDTTSPRGRKRARGSKSVTASPGEGPSEEPKEPERKLKRPRTRRVLDRPETAASPAIATSSRPSSNGRRPSPPPSTANINGQPSFLSTLLKEVEMATPSDDERSGMSAMPASVPNRVTSPSIDSFSPVTSPASSSYSTPRALSITPPPHLKSRSRSPLPLTSRVEPIFPPADYSPNRSPDTNKSTDRDHSPTEIRQPRPRRRRPVPLPRSEDTSPEKGPISPVRATMSIEAKEGINKIVKSALAPHWKSAEITKEQYADINRDVSRKLYEIIADRNLSDEREKHQYEKVAMKEVAMAVNKLVAA